MKVLLTHAYFLEEDPAEKKIMKPYPPLGLLYISGYLSQNKVEHEVFDTTFSDQQSQKKFIKEYQPNVIGIYCNLMTKVNVVQLVAWINSEFPNTKIVLGGPDVRYNVEDYLKTGAHFAVIGEGEETFYELVNHLENEKEEFNNIPGLAFRMDEKTIKNKDRPLLKDIDELPFPALNRISVEEYMKTWYNYHGESMLSISTQRGCPYTCKWCSTAVYGQSYRRKSPEKVVEELKMMIDQYNPSAFWFVDDVFTVSHKWLATFNEALKEAKMNIKYECISRADRMNEEVIQLLKESGCFRIWIGAESGSQKILDAMDRRVKASQVSDMIQASKKAGIQAGTFIMFGYPGETMEDIIETKNHLIRANPDQFTITLTYPIKGTSLYDEIEASQIGSFNWTEQSDRERKFKRKYSDQFYKMAIRNVVNEVAYKTKEQSFNSRIKNLLKYKSSALFMKFLS